MPDDGRAVAAVKISDLSRMPLEQAVEAYTPNFAAVLPSHVGVDRFKRVVLTAVAQNPDLEQADRRTLFTACLKCANDGLLPDGREAALTIFNTKMKVNGQETWVKAVSYLPMIAGVRKRMRNSGQVLSAEAYVVYEKDVFVYELGDNPRIDHKPAQMTEDGGKAVGAYAIIKLANGETIREIMSVREIERARAVSKAGQIKGAPWDVWWSEMAKKTVLRRASKAAPFSAELEALLQDGEPDLPGADTVAELPARPTRNDFVEHETVVEEDPDLFEVIDEVGETVEVHRSALVETLSDIFKKSATRGRAALTTVGESNKHIIEDLQKRGDKKTAAEIIAAWRDADPGEEKTPLETAAEAKPEDNAASQAEGAAEPDPEPTDSPTTIEPGTLKGGKPDWSGWVLAFMSAARETKEISDLAMLIGDNQAYLDDCKKAIGTREAGALQAQIDAQWRRIDAAS